MTERPLYPREAEAISRQPALSIMKERTIGSVFAVVTVFATMALLAGFVIYASPAMTKPPINTETQETGEHDLNTLIRQYSELESVYRYAIDRDKPGIRVKATSLRGRISLILDAMKDEDIPPDARRFKRKY